MEYSLVFIDGTLETGENEVNNPSSNETRMHDHWKF